MGFTTCRMCSACAKPVLAIGLAVLLAGCGAAPSPGDRLKAAIAAFVEALEDGEPRRAGELLHPAYQDTRHPDRRSAVASLFWYTRQHRDIHLFTLVRDSDIDAASDSARTGVLVAMAGVPIESIETLVSINADLYRFDVDWRHEDGEWRATSAQWQRADLSSL